MPAPPYPRASRFASVLRACALALLLGHALPAAAEQLSPAESSAVAALEHICADPALAPDRHAALEAATGTGRPLREALAAARNQLLHRLRIQLYEESLRLATGLVPYAALAGADAAASADATSDCGLQLPEAEASHLAEQHQGVELARRRWSTVAPAAQGPLLELLAAAVYERAFIHHMLLDGRWRHQLPELAPLLADGDTGALAYPESRVSTATMHPARRLLELDRDFPLLQRPGRWFLGLPLEELGTSLFRAWFPPGRPGLAPVLERLEEDCRPALLERLREERERAAGDEGASGPDQRSLALRAWTVFLSRDLPGIVERAVAGRGPLTPQEQRTLGAEALRWERELDAARHTACSAPDDLIEEIPGLLALYLERHPGELSGDELAAFCDGDWGQTGRRQGETLAKVAGGALVALGTGLPGAQWLLPVGGALAGLGYAGEGVRGMHHAALQSALFHPGIAERAGAHLRTTATLLAAPLTLAGAALLQRIPLLQAGRGHQLFLPWGWQQNTLIIAGGGHLVGNAVGAYNYLRQGIDPFRERVFWINFFAGYLKMLAVGSALGSGTLQELIAAVGINVTVTVLVDQYLQNANYLLTGQPFDPRVSSFAILFDNLIGLPASLHVKALATLSSLLVGSAIPGSRPIAAAVLTATNTYFLAALNTSAYIKYLEQRNTGFWQALRDSLNWQDLNVFAAVEPAAPTAAVEPVVEPARASPAEGAGEEQFAALQALLRTYAAAEEPGADLWFELHRLVEEAAASPAPGAPETGL